MSTTEERFNRAMQAVVAAYLTVPGSDTQCFKTGWFDKMAELEAEAIRIGRELCMGASNDAS